MPKFDMDKTEKAVDAFLDKHSKAPFQIDTLRSFLKQKFKKLEKDDFDEALAHSVFYLGALSKVLSYFKKETFQCKKSFFKGACLRVVPSKMELSNGMLIPGARFAPFCDSEIFPDEVTLLQEGSAKPLENFEFSAPFEQMSDQFLLLGYSGIMDTLSAESEINRAVLKDAHSLHSSFVKITVFDMSGFYKKSSFRDGDAVIFTVKDWSNGEFEFRHESVRPSDADRNAWVSALEHSLIQTYETFRDYIEIPEQLAGAFFMDAMDGGSLIKDPVVSLDEYPRLMKDISIMHLDSDWLLAPVEELSDSSVNDDGSQTQEPPEGFSVSAGKTDSLESILSDISSPAGIPEIHAMMLDEIANAGESFDDFFARSIAPLALKFTDDAQEATFLNFIEDLWEDSMDRFSSSVDEPKAPLRARLLEMLSRRQEFNASIASLPPSSAPKERFDACLMAIVATLSLLNADAALPEGEEYESLELRIGDIEDEWDSLADILSL